MYAIAMRLFTAIDLSPEVLGRIDQLLARLRPAAKLRWSPLENLHITTKFIGEWPAERLDDLTQALRELPPQAPFEVCVRGLGWFPNPHAPRVFWAAVHAPPALPELARQTEQRLVPLGIPVEDRPFTPHLTLARVRPPVELGTLRRQIASLGDLDFGCFPVSRFFLYQSEMGSGGSRYTRLAEFPLEQN